MKILSSLDFAATIPSTLASDRMRNARSCGDSAKIRLLFAAQVVVSLIALPIILLLGFFEAAFLACKGKGKAAFKDYIDVLKLEVGLILPMSAVGIFAPLATTHKCADWLASCIE